MTTIAIIFPLLIIVSLSVSLNSYLKTWLKIGNAQAMLTSIALSPLLTSLALYYLFIFTPSQPKLFYIAIFILGNMLIFLIRPRAIIKNLLWLKTFRFNLFQLQPSFYQVVLIGLVSFLFLLTTLRIFLWPINWDDQIYYIQQSYSIGQERTTDTFQNWGVFDNGILRYQMNPTIRPGLPLVYSLSTLFSMQIEQTVLFARMITFYYVLLLVALVVYFAKKVSKKHVSEFSLISLMLMFSTYLFVNLTVLGFKELLIICLLLLGLDVIAELKKKRDDWKQYILIGVLSGLMSYINFSGSLIMGVMLLLVYSNTGISFLTIKKSIVVLLIAFTMSGFESVYALSMAASGGFAKITLKDQAQFVSVLISNVINKEKKPYPNVALDTSGISQNNTGSNEFESYGIDSPLSVYTRGKLQGFFQLEYFGFVFWLFLLTLILRVKQLWRNSFHRQIVLFIIFYYIFFIDIFRLNPHQFSAVLTVSHKYTALLVPLISIIVGAQWHWFRNLLSFFSEKFALIFSGLLFLICLLYIKYNLNDIYEMIMVIIPVHNPREYYINIISAANTLLIYITAVTGIIIFVGISHWKQGFTKWWSTNYMGSLYFYVIVIFMPFLFFFNTNFGIKETLFHSFSPTNVKLAEIKGWNGLYLMVNFLNTLPRGSKVLFVNAAISQLKIHLKAPSSDILGLRTTTDRFWIDFKREEFKEVDYVLFKTDSVRFSSHTPLFATEQYVLYENNFSDNDHPELLP